MDTIKSINEWFQAAMPEPTEQNRRVQYGCMLEEVAEALRESEDQYEEDVVSDLAMTYKSCESRVGIKFPEKMLDALCDIIVTAVGVAHTQGYDIMGALAEVNRSNWSKFVDGKPVFDANGKIAKPAGYSPPDLTTFVK